MPQRKKRYRLPPRALAARRANLAKAWAAPKEVIYRPTEKRQAASRAIDLDSPRRGSSVTKKTDLVDELIAAELSRRLAIASGDHDWTLAPGAP